MTASQIEILELPDTGDGRGQSFSFLGAWIQDTFPLRNIHLTITHPNCVRGNHFHAVQREILLVSYTDNWSFTWDSGSDTPIQSKDFSGAGAVAIVVPPLASHAIKNDGSTPLTIIALSDREYDAAGPDVVPRVLTE